MSLTTVTSHLIRKLSYHQQSKSFLWMNFLCPERRALPPAAAKEKVVTAELLIFLYELVDSTGLPFLSGKVNSNRALTAALASLLAPGPGRSRWR